VVFLRAAAQGQQNSTAASPPAAPTAAVQGCQPEQQQQHQGVEHCFAAAATDAENIVLQQLLAPRTNSFQQQVPQVDASSPLAPPALDACGLLPGREVSRPNSCGGCVAGYQRSSSGGRISCRSPLQHHSRQGSSSSIGGARNSFDAAAAAAAAAQWVVPDPGVLGSSPPLQVGGCS